MIKKIILASSLLVSSVISTSSQALLQGWEFKPSLGADVTMRHQDFDKGFGEEHFREHYPGVNLYMSAIFHKYLGMEAGYEHMFREEKKQFYGNRSPVLGFFNPQFNTAKLYLSDVFMQGWHVDLLAYLPICPKLRTDLFGSVGLGWLKMHYETAQVNNLAAATPVERWESDSRTVLRLGLGLKQMITDNFGLRLQFLWEDTSKLDATRVVPRGQGGVLAPRTAADSYTVKADDSYSIGLGFFFQIA